MTALLPAKHSPHLHTLPNVRLSQRPQRHPLIARCTASHPPAQPPQQPAAPEQSKEAALEEALKQAQAALQEAERGVELVDTLPSARGPSRLSMYWQKVAPFVLSAAAITSMTLGAAYGFHTQRLTGFLGAVLLGGSGWRRGSLSGSGALAAALVGALTIGYSFRGGCVLLAFYLSSSKLTKYKEEVKAVDVEFKAGGQRDWKQVLCNALIPALLALWYGTCTLGRDLALGLGVASCSPTLLTALAGGFLGYYACCCGDTWASELGQLSPDTPRLITSLRPVRKGTNGGVSFLGLAASVAGGLFVGLVFYGVGVWSPSQPARAVAMKQWVLLPLGAAAGLLGSIVDSLLGATVQFSGFDRVKQKVTSRPGPTVVPIAGYPLLDNNAVNLVSACLTALWCSLAAVLIFV